MLNGRSTAQICVIWADGVFQFAWQASAMQEDFGEDRNMLTADDNWEDEGDAIQEEEEWVGATRIAFYVYVIETLGLSVASKLLLMYDKCSPAHSKQVYNLAGCCFSVCWSRLCNARRHRGES